MKNSWEGVKAAFEKAMSIIQTDRNSAYGNPEDNFADIAEMWTTFLRAKGYQVNVEAADVAWMMVLLKACRDAKVPNFDNRVDAMGYVGCAERVQPTWPGEDA